MAGDISRSSFQRLKGNTGVRMQQGRVQLDADWNEQLDIQAYRERTLTTDLLGSAAPIANAGFAIVADGTTLAISPGRMYVEGILCENAGECLVMPVPPPVTSQPPPNEPPNPGMDLVPFRPGTGLINFAGRVDIAQLAKQNLLPDIAATRTGLVTAALSARSTPSAAATATGARPAAASTPAPADTTTYPLQPYPPGMPAVTNNTTYAVFLDVWERDITVLEDPSIREVALGGPDTTTRTRVVWQVKLAQYSSSTCPTDVTSLIKPSTGQLYAQTAANQSSSNPCVIPASAGYRSLENQLYRVEIHTPGAAGTATFKWSRDNASVAVAWQGGSATDLSVSSLGRDDVLGFAAGQWVELIDDTHEYTGTPGTLVQLSNAQLVGQVPTLSLNTSTASGSTTFTDFPQTPRVRRWDQTASATAQLSSGAVPVTEGQPIDLEQGVQVYFEPQQQGAYYNTGDYWLIPARTATSASQPTVIWPVDATNTPLPQSPNGITHHYAPLAVASLNNYGVWSVGCDCRSTFAPMSTPAGVQVLSATIGEGTPLTPFMVVSPIDLIDGIAITFDQPISQQALNVGTLSISLDVATIDNGFGQAADLNKQVGAATAVKLLGSYSLNGGYGVENPGTIVTWTPFNSTRAYMLTELARLGVLTAGQGGALVRIDIDTAALRSGACNGSSLFRDSSSTVSLAFWSEPYLEGFPVLAPVFMQSPNIQGPDSNGNYIAIGIMDYPTLFIMREFAPAEDVGGDKLLATPLQLVSGKYVYGIMPTAADLAGNFSSFLEPLIDPRTGQAYPGNQIPTSEWPTEAENGFFAWRFRGYVPAATGPYYGYGYGHSYGYGYGAGAAIGGELI